MFANQDIPAASRGDENLANLGRLLHSGDLEASHGGLQSIDGIDLGDNNAGTHALQRHGASLADIMRETGLEKGGIYNHFSSKEQLALESFDYAYGLIQQRVRQALSKALDRQALISAADGNGWIAAGVVLSGDELLPDAEIQRLLARDVPAAKQLLQMAGVSNWSPKLSTIGTGGQGTPLVEATQAQLKEAGINSTIDIADIAGFTAPRTRPVTSSAFTSTLTS